MNTCSHNSVRFAVAFIVVFVFCTARPLHAQSVDTVAVPSVSYGALQFELWNRLGVHYIGNWQGSTSYRIGAEGTWINSNWDSGDESHTTSTQGGNPSTVSSYQTESPDRQSHYYEIRISAVCLQQLVSYRASSLYGGAGISAGYGWSSNSSTYTSTNTEAQGSYTTRDVDEHKNKTNILGGLALLGVSSRLTDGVALCAEVVFSADYQRSSGSSTSQWVQESKPSGAATIQVGNGSSYSNGWSVGINALRISLIIGL